MTDQGPRPEFDQNGIQRGPDMESSRSQPTLRTSLQHRQRSLSIRREDLDATGIAWMTITVIAVAVIIEGSGFFAAMPAENALGFAMWALAPYVGHLLLALAFRRHLASSLVFLAGTVLIAWFVNDRFYSYFQHYIMFRESGGPRPMNCAGPIIEVGLPLLQWIAVGLLGFLAGLLMLAFRAGGNANSM